MRIQKMLNRPQIILNEMNKKTISIDEYLKKQFKEAQTIIPEVIKRSIKSFSVFYKIH